MAYPFVSNQYWDTSSVGGICRQKCDSQINPSECCRLKAGLPSCKDSDCEGALYIGGNNTAWDPYRKILTWQYPTQYQVPTQFQVPTYTYPAYQYPTYTYNQYPAYQYPTYQAYTYNQYPATQPPSTLPECAMYPSCNSSPDPFACCRSKPGLCYDPDCIGGEYRVNKWQGFVRPSGSECLTWPPCSASSNPRACCVSKPPGCDPWCSMVGSSVGTVSNPVSNPVTFDVNYANNGDCRTWPPCAHSPNPDLCCKTKPVGCDTDCFNYRFAGSRRYRGYDGSTFNKNRAGATDQLYGVDPGYVSDFGA